MTDQLEIRYVPLSQVALWERNPKLHHLGDLAASIEHHGFKESPRYEPTLNDGTGGIVAGNGRIETLVALRNQRRPAPRGIVEQDGEWLVPVTFGVDAESQEAAEAYGIDANNLTMSGGDFTPWDMARMWDRDAYAALLTELAQSDALPVTVDGDALDALLRGATGGVDPNELWKGMPEFEQNAMVWKELRVYFTCEDDYRAFSDLIGQPLTDKSTFIWYPRQEKENLLAYSVEDES